MLIYYSLSENVFIYKNYKFQLWVLSNIDLRIYVLKDNKGTFNNFPLLMVENKCFFWHCFLVQKMIIQSEENFSKNCLNLHLKIIIKKLRKIEYFCNYCCTAVLLVLGHFIERHFIERHFLKQDIS